MALTPGLVPTIRQPAPEGEQLPDPVDLVVEAAAEGEDVPEFDTSGNILKIEHGDGSITVSLDGRPIEEGAAAGPAGWYDNLVDSIDEGELNRISGELLRGIEDDIRSRADWIENRALGIKLMGLKIEVPGLQGASDGAPVEGMSKVRHPLLLEAVLRFQANARSELLPTDGPVKIRNDDNDADLKEDQTANALENDLNHYLTAVATEYYPDTDRMLLMLGFGGTAFKKVYFCPLRNRPVSETVDADDLIVNQAATDLANAKRVTHRVFMRPSTVKRLQILGVYKDTDLSTPNAPKLDSLQREERSQQGLQAESFNPDDRDREIYECYCELDISGFEHKHKGKVSGLEIPYIVTLDLSSRQVLSVVRNYSEDDQDLPTARKRFVKYTFVPGLGFYDIGLLNILGNTTNAITAAWRELLDAGMYSNFPGFLMADTGGRQNTNIFRVPPGGGALVKTGGMPISQAIMPLPYQPPSQALMQLVGDMAQTGMRIGGTSEQQVGEGREEAPVGTTLAMIEQATKVMNAVHKRMHAAQAEEFKLLIDVFKDHPDSFWQRGCKSRTKWNEKTFIDAISNCELVPQADPNTASHGQRVMKVMALKQLQSANPSLYDPLAIDMAAIRAIGWSNPQQFMKSAQAQMQPPPELVQAKAKIDNETKEANARLMDSQTKANELQAKIAQGAFAPRQQSEGSGGGASQQIDTQADLMQAQAKLMDAHTKRAELGIQHHDREDENQNRALDRHSREKVQVLELARDILLHPGNTGEAEKVAGTISKDVGRS
jgi:hypothetical protein